MTRTRPVPVSPAAALASAVAELKPRLRGWLHAYAAAISIASGVVLVAVAAVGIVLFVIYRLVFPA